MFSPGPWVTTDQMIHDAEKYHREMWGWLAKNPGNYKDQWPQWERFERIPAGRCFACVISEHVRESVEVQDLREVGCAGCPICSDDLLVGMTTCLNGLYGKWELAELTDYPQRSAVAQQIADLPWLSLDELHERCIRVRDKKEKGGRL